MLKKDYEADHPEIALLRLRNYTIGRKLKDEEVLGKGALDKIADLLGILTPFVSHIPNIVIKLLVLTYYFSRSRTLIAL